MARRGPKVIDPTPQEIEIGARLIRAGWSERTHRIRAGWTVEAADRMEQWTTPIVHLSDLCFDEAESEEYPYWAN